MVLSWLSDLKHAYGQNGYDVQDLAMFYHNVVLEGLIKQGIFLLPDGLIRLDNGLRGDFDNGQSRLSDHDNGYLVDHDVCYLGDHDEGDLAGNGMASAVRSDKRINLGWSPLVTSTKVKEKTKTKNKQNKRSSRLVNN